MHFTIPEPIQVSIHLLNQSGYQAYLVGGAVRDFARGATPKDFDICTSALPEQTMEVFSHFKTFPIGLKYGTITVLINQFAIEITTFRQDKDYVDGRHPDDVSFTSSLKEDLARRDFTINALAYHPDIGLVDYFGGLSDLESNILRTVRNPAERFQEDSLRILRALRFAATLNLKVDSATSQAILKLFPSLEQIAKERIQVELSKLLLGENCKNILLVYREVFAFIIPELEATFDFDQRNYHHIFDVYRHIIEVISHTPPILELRLAALFHDIAKPLTFSLDEKGIGHFYGHAGESSILSKQILSRLRFDKHTTDTVYKLIKYHDTPLPEEKTLLKKRASKLGFDLLYKLIELQKADCLGQAPFLHQERLAKLEYIKGLIQELEFEKPPFSVKDLEVDGYDAMKFGLQGPQIGSALNLLFEKVLSDEIENNRNRLLEELAEISAQE